MPEISLTTTATTTIATSAAAKTAVSTAASSSLKSADNTQTSPAISLLSSSNGKVFQVSATKAQHMCEEKKFGGKVKANQPPKKENKVILSKNDKDAAELAKNAGDLQNSSDVVAVVCSEVGEGRECSSDVWTLLNASAVEEVLFDDDDDDHHQQNFTTPTTAVQTATATEITDSSTPTATNDGHKTENIAGAKTPRTSLNIINGENTKNTSNNNSSNKLNTKRPYRKKSSITTVYEKRRSLMEKQRRLNEQLSRAASEKCEHCQRKLSASNGYSNGHNSSSGGNRKRFVSPRKTSSYVIPIPQTLAAPAPENVKRSFSAKKCSSNGNRVVDEDLEEPVVSCLSPVQIAVESASASDSAAEGDAELKQQQQNTKQQRKSSHQSPWSRIRNSLKRETKNSDFRARSKSAALPSTVDARRRDADAHAHEEEAEGGSISQNSTINYNSDKAALNLKYLARQRFSVNPAIYNSRHRVITPLATTTMGLCAPPVFPSNVSLFDGNLRGGFYRNAAEDQIIVKAIEEARQKWHRRSTPNLATNAQTGSSNFERLAAATTPSALTPTSTSEKAAPQSAKRATLSAAKSDAEVQFKFIDPTRFDEPAEPIPLRHEQPIRLLGKTKSEDFDEDEEQIDSGRSSLVGSSRLSVRFEDTESAGSGSARLSSSPKRVNCQCSSSMASSQQASTDSYNGEFYSSPINKCEETEANPKVGVDTVVNAVELAENLDIGSEVRSKPAFSQTSKVATVSAKRGSRKSVKARLKKRSAQLRAAITPRSRPPSEMAAPNAFVPRDDDDEKHKESDKHVYKTIHGCYTKRNISPPANNNPNDDTIPKTSASCHASSSLATQWRKFLRTFSGGIMPADLKGEKPSAESFGARGGADLNREWEVVTVRELCRRLSLEDSLEPSEMPLPEGAQQSRVLDEFMIRQIVDILPPRAEGYPWVNIYSSEKHGFSLSTLYRKMSEWTEEMSPVLLIVRDVNSHVFGAVASTALRPSEHYYGTGDSCILFRFTGEFPHTRELRSYTWTGDNQFFINATKDFLSMGGGGGHYGLWLDADLNNGRSQRCATFDNEPLAGNTVATSTTISSSSSSSAAAATTAAGAAGGASAGDLTGDGGGDFVVQYVEAFGFSMS